MVDPNFLEEQFTNYNTKEHKRALPPEQAYRYFATENEIVVYFPKKPNKTQRSIFEIKNYDYLPYEKKN